MQILEQKKPCLPPIPVTTGLAHPSARGRDRFTGSCGQICFRLWRGVSALNKHHAFWAWVSLFGVGFADFYVWMVSSGRLHDPVLIG